MNNRQGYLQNVINIIKENIKDNKIKSMDEKLNYELKHRKLELDILKDIYRRLKL